MGSEYILGPNGELYHWGIKGMRWGVRRYQNADGTLTPAGKNRYGKEETPEQRYIVEKARRSKLTEEQTIAELKEICNSDPTDKKWLELDNEIRTFSGDWYESEGVSKSFKRTVSKHNSERDRIDNKYRDQETAIDKAWSEQMNRLEKIYPLRDFVGEKKLEKIEEKSHVLSGKKWLEVTAERSRYEDELLGVVLEDLGYKDSLEARRLIRDIVIWD